MIFSIRTKQLLLSKMWKTKIDQGLSLVASPQFMWAASNIKQVFVVCVLNYFDFGHMNIFLHKRENLNWVKPIEEPVVWRGISVSG